MFDQFQNDQDEGMDTASKILTICAIGAGIGFGTCSLAAVTIASRGQLGLDIAIGCATLFFLSLAGLVITGLYMVAVSIGRSFRR